MFNNYAADTRKSISIRYHRYRHQGKTTSIDASVVMVFGDGEIIIVIKNIKFNFRQ